MQKTYQFGDLTVIQHAVLKDNYNYILHSSRTGETALIDPSLAEPNLALIQQRGWVLGSIFNTHHHWDHTDGNLPIKEATGCRIYGYADDAARIPGINETLSAEQRFHWGGFAVEVLFLPGHTTGHIAYHIAEAGCLFSGDVIFSMGCGRLFEGIPAQAFQSLRTIAALPEDTQIFCAHEYTETNARFALTVEPNNPDLQHRWAKVKALRASGEPTIPMTIALEKATNPFLRAGSVEIAANLGLAGQSELEVFTALREKRNGFS